MLYKLGLAEAGGNYTNIKSKIKQFDLDVSHFHGKGWRKGKYDFPQSLSQIMVRNSSYRTSQLKKRLFRKNIKHPQCEICKLKQWRGDQLSFELHHINGVRDDHRLCNLQILCPNCHSQTKHFRNRKQT